MAASFKREGKIRCSRDANDCCIRGCRIDFIHGVGGDGEQQFIVRIEKGLAKNVDCFVDTIGEDDLFRGEA
jgi:hypothetical protein